MKAYKAVINANTGIFKDTALTEQMSDVDSAMLKSMEGSKWTFPRKSETTYPRSFRC